MKKYERYLVWLLVISGLLRGYEGLANVNLFEQLLGSQLGMVGDVIIGIAAILVGYSMLAGKKR